MSDLEESHRRIKRLVVLSDGTWQTPENKIPTNILKLTMAMLHESPGDNIQQVRLPAPRLAAGVDCTPQSVLESDDRWRAMTVGLARPTMSKNWRPLEQLLTDSCFSARLIFVRVFCLLVLCAPGGASIASNLIRTSAHTRRAQN